MIEAVKHRMVGLEISMSESELDLLPVVLQRFLMNGETMSRNGPTQALALTNNFNSNQNNSTSHVIWQNGHWCSGNNCQCNSLQL